MLKKIVKFYSEILIDIWIIYLIKNILDEKFIKQYEIFKHFRNIKIDDIYNSQYFSILYI